MKQIGGVRLTFLVILRIGCHSTLPSNLLSINLISTRSSRSWNDVDCWTRKESMFRLIFSLCRERKVVSNDYSCGRKERKRVPLEIVRLLAQRTKDVWEVFFNNVKDGRLVYVTTLLLVAHEKVMPTKIPEEKPKLTLHDGEIDCHEFIGN